ncbi:gliding motility-associated C-terminal domain-containing protein, partial [Flavobacterium sufflavum]
TTTDNCKGTITGTTTTVFPITTQGTTVVTWTFNDGNGNITTATQKVIVKDITAPVAPTLADVTGQCSATATAPTTTDNCKGTITGTTNDPLTYTTQGTHIITWTFNDGNGNITTATQKVIVNIVPSITTITVPEIINSINGTPVDLTSYLPQDAPKNGTWVDTNNSGALNGSILNPNNVASADYSFQYIIETQACPIIYVINLKIDQSFVLGCGTINVHNAFSPNGDQFNEVFKIDNIEDTLCYPENSVEIYNRWGILVYETKGYDNVNNVFKGYSEGRVTVDKNAGLPTGTYFYILNYTSVGLQNEIIPNKKQGYLYLTR